jgi:hypothetical protein
MTIFDDKGEVACNAVGLTFGIFRQINFSNPKQPTLPKSALLELEKWQQNADSDSTETAKHQKEKGE